MTAAPGRDLSAGCVVFGRLPDWRFDDQFARKEAKYSYFFVKKAV